MVSKLEKPIMLNFFKKTLFFIKENPRILYSLFLIIIIPLTIFYITFSTSKKFQEAMDSTLRMNISLIQGSIGNLIFDEISQRELLQEKIEKIAKENPEIRQLRIILPEEGKFKITASQNPQEIGKPIEGKAIEMAFAQDEAIAFLTYDEKNQERRWEAFKSFKNKEGERIGVIGMGFSLKTTDLLMKKIFFSTYIVATIAILLTLFLVLHHTQLFGYVSLSKKLQEIDKAKDEFIRMATHELQSPIANIRGYILTLKEEIENTLTQQQKEYFFRIEISAKNLSNLIDDILEVARIEQGRLDFTPQIIQAQKIIDETVKELELKAKEKGLKLVFQSKEETSFIRANPNRLRQIIFNLVDNAIKYTFFGEIKVETKEDLPRKKYYIIIQDSGIGIPAEAQKRLFEKFYRVKTKETTDISGTGLGLWITKEITKRVGGDIYFESMEKIGTKFVIVFPLVKT